MDKKLFYADIREHKLLTFSIVFFMTISSALFALTLLLSSDLLTSIDCLMKKAGTPDYLQMHAGDIHEEEIRRFAEENPDVEEYQILTFLNLEGSMIRLNGNTLENSTQDNGICVQSKSFDFLLDLKDELIEAKEGEIYVPVCYRNTYGLQEGDPVLIGTQKFRIAGFLRDSQMNSMMASSKRFLVSESDYRRLQPAGQEEYLIEFLLRAEADKGKVASAYAQAGLPANGPAITRALIRMMNAISDGMTVLVVFIMSVVMLLIAMGCIHFLLLLRLMEDRKEIGLLRAVGYDGSAVRKIYLKRYSFFAGIGAVIGISLAYAMKEPLQAQMQELYGRGDGGSIVFLMGVFGALLNQGILLLSVRKTLGRELKGTVLSGMQGALYKKGAFQEWKQYALLFIVIAAGTFLIVIPQNLVSTISSESFAAYMGIGCSQLRMDIRQSEDILGQSMKAEEMLGREAAVEKEGMLIAKVYDRLMEDGSYQKVNVELGDHSVFPVAYHKGRQPEKNGELAVSYLLAQDHGLTPGDKITLLTNGKEKDYLICGIYSDITNGGKTAKALWQEDNEPVSWSVCYFSLKEGTDRETWMREWEQKLAAEGIKADVVDIQEYVRDTYGPTIEQVRLAAGAAAGMAVSVIFWVTFLLVKLWVEKDRYEISLKRALGFTAMEIKKTYFAKFTVITILAALAGIVSGHYLGQSLLGIILRSMGAAGFRFLISGKIVYIAIPLLVFVAAIGAMLPGIGGIGKIKPYECCMERE